MRPRQTRLPHWRRLQRWVRRRTSTPRKPPRRMQAFGPRSRASDLIRFSNQRNAQRTKSVQRPHVRTITNFVFISLGTFLAGIGSIPLVWLTAQQVEISSNQAEESQSVNFLQNVSIIRENSGKIRARNYNTTSISIYNDVWKFLSSRTDTRLPVNLSGVTELRNFFRAKEIYLWRQEIQIPPCSELIVRPSLFDKKSRTLTEPFPDLPEEKRNNHGMEFVIIDQEMGNFILRGSRGRFYKDTYAGWEQVAPNYADITTSNNWYWWRKVSPDTYLYVRPRLFDRATPIADCPK